MHDSLKLIELRVYVHFALRHDSRCFHAVRGLWSIDDTMRLRDNRADPVFVGRWYHVISLLQTKYPTIYITRPATNHKLCYFAAAAEVASSPGPSCFCRRLRGIFSLWETDSVFFPSNEYRVGPIVYLQQDHFLQNQSLFIFNQRLKTIPVLFFSSQESKAHFPGHQRVGRLWQERINKGRENKGWKGRK